MSEIKIKNKNLNKRVFAFLIDWGIFVVIRFIINHQIIIAMMFVYFLFRDALFEGQSIGKKAAGLKVVDPNNQKCSLWRSCLRNILFLIPLLGVIIEYIVMGISGDARRIGDHIAGTTVVDERPEVSDFYLGVLSVILLFFLLIISGSGSILSL